MWKIMRSNLAFKIISLCLAVLLWIYVANEQRTSQVLTVPLELVNADSNLVLLDTPPTQVQVQVQGDKDILTDFATKNLRAYVDLKNAKVGKGSYPIQVEASDKLVVVSKKPATVDLTFDMAEERTVEILVRVAGTASTGFRIMDPTVKPVQVTLSGPANALSQVEKAVVDVDLGTGAQENKTVSVPVRAIDKKGNLLEDQLIHYSPKNVEVTIPVLPDQPTKVVPVKVSYQGTPAPGYQVNRITSKPEVVKIIGPQDRLDGIESVPTMPVDISGAQKEIAKDVPLQLPMGVEVVGNPLVKVSVEIGEKTGERKTFSGIPFTAQGLDVGLILAATPDQGAVTVEGPSDLLARLGSKDFILILDLTGKGPGVYTVPVQATYPSGVKLVGADPSQITVTITR